MSGLTADDEALIARFRAFIEKITGRLDDIFREANDGLAAIRAKDSTAWREYGNAMSGIRARVHQLSSTLSETWDDKIEPAFSHDDRIARVFDIGIEMYEDAEALIEDRYEAFSVRAMADFARVMFPVAQQELASVPACDQCGKPLRVADRLVAEAVKCDGCGSVNQVLPPTYAAMFADVGSRYLGEEAALPLRQEITAWRRARDRARRNGDRAPESAESLKRWEAMEHGYWTKVAEERARVSGRPVDLEFVESRVEYLRRELRRLPNYPR